MRKDNEYPTEELTVEIERFDHQGHGYAAYYHKPKREGNQGRKLNISVLGTLPGDIVKVTIENAYGRRKAVGPYDEIIQWSPSRIGQAESGMGMDGGSPLKYMNYPDQLKYKEDLVM